MAKGRTPARGSAKSPAPDLKQPEFLQKHTHTIYVSLIALLLIVFFHEAFFSGKVFFVPDNASSIAIEEGYLKEADDAGVNPFWNPYVFSGMPTWGSSSPGHGMYLHTFLDPLQPMLVMQVYGWAQGVVNVLPLPGMFWDVFNYFLLGLFTYLLGLRRKFEPFAAFLVAVSVVFSLYSLNWIMAGHNTKITVFAWLPATLLLIDLLFEKRTILRVAFLIAALHFTFNSGHVQMVFYNLMAIGMFIMYKWYSGESFGKVALVSGITIGAAAFAFLMLSGPYFATWEYKDFSIRGAGSGGSGHGTPTGGLDYDYATNWSFSLPEIVTFFVPSFVGFGSPTYWGTMTFTESPIYLGVVISFFALLGIVLRPRDKFVHLWLALGFLALLVALGRNFSLVFDLFFNHVPFFNNFRIPSMILYLNALCVGMLAGVGLTEILRLLRERQAGAAVRLKKALWLPVAIAAVMVLILLLSQGGYTSAVADMMQKYQPRSWSAIQQVEQAMAAGQSIPVEYQGYTRAAIYKEALNDAFLALLFMAGAALLLWAFVKAKISVTVLQVGLLLILVLDWWIVDYKPMNLVHARQQEESLQPTDVVRFLKQDPDVFRILPASDHGSDNWYVAFTIQSVAGYHPAKLKLYDDVRNSMFNAFQFQSPEHLESANWAMLSMLNTKYVVVPNTWQLTRPWLKLVFQGNRESVYENQYVLPRAFFVASHQVIPDDEEMFNTIATLPGYRPDQVAYLSDAPDRPLVDVPDSLIALTTAELKEFGINHFSYEVSTPVDALLKLSEVYYTSGWTATLNGEPIEILRSDYTLRAVIVPAGTHTLEMRYEPESYLAGLIVTTVTNYTLAAVLLLYAVFWIRKRVQNASAGKR
jgi:hypothetical protein